MDLEREKRTANNMLLYLTGSNAYETAKTALLKLKYVINFAQELERSGAKGGVNSGQAAGVHKTEPGEGC